MNAAYRTKYGPPKVLKIKELDKPSSGDNEILIRIHAATVNRSDCHILTGKPYMMRLFLGLFKPKHPTTGTDFSGEIEATGKNVTAFNNGDKVMGFCGGLIPVGSHAQYIVLTETKARKIMVAIPGKLNYDQATCLEGAYYAAGQIMGIKPQAGQKALVIGATGAIGSAYVQYLKYYGVQITATCRGEHSELLRTMGADRTIDYLKEDFTKDNEQYDFIFDSTGKSSFLKCKKLLKKQGLYTSSHGAINIFLLPLTRLFGGRKVIFHFPKNFTAVLNFVRDQMERGSYKPVIDRKYSLEQIAAAYTYVATGQKVGNVIIEMD
jgi:NADPH:quinone reductase-like Zn-dependent oxidoreductase